MTGKNPKITKVQTTNPQPDGVINRGRPKTYVKHVQPHPTHTMNQKMTRLVIGIQPRHHRHTPKKSVHHTVHKTRAGKHTHATKVHWHTIEFSNNTSTPNINPHTVSQRQSDFGIYQRLFSCPPHKPENLISLSSGALSVSLTRYKLHTPHTQHKPAAKRGF